MHPPGHWFLSLCATWRCCPHGPWLRLTWPLPVYLLRLSPSATTKFLEGRTRPRFLWRLHPVDRGLGSARWKGLNHLFVHWETKSILSRHCKPGLLCEHTVPFEEQGGKKTLLVQCFPWTLTSRRSDFFQNQQDKTLDCMRPRASPPHLGAGSAHSTSSPHLAHTLGTGAESLQKSLLHE